ncbi:hypothetical protein [Fodinibius sediminis]|uniref:Uncharacterized protein n=1 Tax=Fodinibius sediminis TaxID=1214077 RepID=A0A521CJI7_9BACT|nr:hypothetical protein [Fodinibius sediminis]SMO59606.1 hypothetical protein SAMN06265218_106124 [Fodinibius sediminis]
MQKRCRKILDLGQAILEEVQCPDPSIEAVRSLYDDRGREIAALEADMPHAADEISEKERNACRVLFDRMARLEKRLNEKLGQWKEQKRQDLESLHDHQEAASRYSDHADYEGGRRNIIDFKLG